MSSSLEIVLSTLKDKGIYVSREWVSQCIAHIKSKNPTAPATEMSDRVFQHFLTTDYRDCCSEEVNAGNVILASINAADKAIIQSSVVLQIDEIVNVGASREHRNTNTSRLLKLYLTNGKTNVIGLELAPIPTLSVSTLVGAKVLVSTGMAYRYGALLLTPATVKLLGGEVERLSMLQERAKSNTTSAPIAVERTEVNATASTNIVTSSSSAHVPTRNDVSPTPATTTVPARMMPVPTTATSSIQLPDPLNNAALGQTNASSSFLSPPRELVTDSPVDLTSSPYISNSAHDVSSRPVDISISYVRSQSGPVGDLSTAADVDFQYSQDYDDDNGVGYTQDNGYGHGSGPDLDISDFVQESRREHDKIDAISSSGAIAAVSEVHLLSIFQADEQELIANDINIFSPILVQAIVLGIRKRAVTCDAYTVWAEVDDGASKEVVAISSKFVETFLKMSPAEYVDLVSSRKLSKQERKEQESKIWIKFYQLCGIFWAKRRKPIHTTMDGNFINLESQENEEEPVIELIELVPDSISSTAESMDVTT